MRAVEYALALAYLSNAIQQHLLDDRTIIAVKARTRARTDGVVDNAKRQARHIENMDTAIGVVWTQLRPLFPEVRGP